MLFDFDGTLSLIREGWPQVMIPMMVSVLREPGTTESDAELSEAVEEFVMRLNGRDTIYQMIELAEQVRRRGAEPLDPLQYKHRYHELLMGRIRGRIEALQLIPRRVDARAAPLPAENAPEDGGGATAAAASPAAVPTVAAVGSA